MSIQNKINKKNKVKKEETNTIKTTPTEIKKLLLIVFGILIVCAIFYGITILFVKDNKLEENKEENKSNVSIQYEEIILSKLLEQSEKDYYVLITLEEDINNKVYDEYKNKYKDKKDAKKIYTSNLNHHFNKNFINDNSNFNINNIKDLKLKESTLIRVYKNKIKEYYEGKNEIISKLKELVK